MKINQLIGTSVLAFLAASGTSALAQPVPSSSSEAPSEVDEEEVEGAEILVFGRLRGVGESLHAKYVRSPCILVHLFHSFGPFIWSIGWQVKPCVEHENVSREWSALPPCSDP